MPHSDGAVSHFFCQLTTSDSACHGLGPGRHYAKSRGKNGASHLKCTWQILFQRLTAQIPTSMFIAIRHGRLKIGLQIAVTVAPPGPCQSLNNLDRVVWKALEDGQAIGSRLLVFHVGGSGRPHNFP